MQQKVENRQNQFLRHAVIKQAFPGGNPVDSAAVGRDGVVDTGSFQLDKGDAVKGSPGGNYYMNTGIRDRADGLQILL